MKKIATTSIVGLALIAGMHSGAYAQYWPGGDTTSTGSTGMPFPGGYSDETTVPPSPPGQGSGVPSNGSGTTPPSGSTGLPTTGQQGSGVPSNGSGTTPPSGSTGLPTTGQQGTTGNCNPRLRDPRLRNVITSNRKSYGKVLPSATRAPIFSGVFRSKCPRGTYIPGRQRR